MNESNIKQHIIIQAQRLHQQGLLAAADGNISYRLADNRILITPAGIAKAFMQPEDMAVITLDNMVLSGNPSSERQMHLAVYQHCPEARCVVHAHPPTAIAWSIAYPDMRELPNRCLSELILACGSVPIAPYARPGAKEMGSVLIPYLPQHRLMILARHGALAWGETLDEAANGIERLEHTAKTLFYAQQLGGITDLPAEEIVFLQNLRAKIGNKLL